MSETLQSWTDRCPYCGEEVELTVEGQGAPTEEYVEDCQVCCRPWRVTVHRDGEEASVEIHRDDD